MYRSHPPAIRLLSDADHVLATLAGQGVRLALISDGPAEAQRRKVEALGLGDRMRPVVLAEYLGAAARKPSPAGFEQVEGAELGAPGGDCLYVADNPTKDFAAPRDRGWSTFQVARHDRLYREADGVRRRPHGGGPAARARAVPRGTGLTREG